MSKDSNSGLLSKVFRFVTKPTTSWSDLDAKEEESESGYSKQMLKDMLERKKRNAFVRKREFDMLRKLRRTEVNVAQGAASRPSFFQTSQPSRPIDDRAGTLKKIDEIEAQMSMQWWKTKQGHSTLNGPLSNFPVSGHVPPDVLPKPSVPGGLPSNYNATEPAHLPKSVASAAPVAPAAPAAPPSALPDLEFPPPSSLVPESTRAHSSMPPMGNTGPAPLSVTGPMSLPNTDFGTDSGGGGFSHSKMHAIVVGDLTSDPNIEEAAILFANGDDEGAEASLKQALATAHVERPETWMVLFDLYRATGQHDAFDSMAIDFVGRFQRSAPQWEVIGAGGAPAAAPAVQNPNPSVTADWTCPATMGTQTVAALVAVLGRLQQPWRLNWTKLTQIEPGAVEPLTRLFTDWAGKKVQLHFIAAEQLERVLHARAPSNDRNVDPAWWLLRLMCLRVMHRPDEFELAALDYCVTYEVSPPSWEPAKCEFKRLGTDGNPLSSVVPSSAHFGDSGMSDFHSGFGHTNLGAGSTNSGVSVTVNLAGEVTGDAAADIERMTAKTTNADEILVSCAGLVRVDFTAAGNLLNWVSRNAEVGRDVRFIGLHRLVACFFSVIGISEHAEVRTRAD